MLQLKKEKARSKNRIEEELAEFQHPDRRLHTAEYCNAESMLSENYQPASILCRNKQIEIIEQFIREALDKKESKQTLYISGVPGIGKTLSVRNVIAKFTANNGESRHNFKYVYLNAMRIKKAHDIFKTFFIELTSHKERNTPAETTMFILDDLFRKGAEPENYKGLAGRMKIVVIDQLDYLMTKDQDVLYNLFDWTQSSKSRLAFIAISNTIHFPETLKPKINSRIGNNRLVFSPYDSKQIGDILKQRVKETEIFEENALEFISKKIAKCSSDIRKCLNVLRQALYIHASQSKNIHNLGKVSFSSLNKAYEKIFNSSFTEIYLAMPVPYKKILCLLANHFKRENYSICLRALCVQTGIHFKIDYPNTKELVLNLSDMGVVGLRYSKNYSGSKFEEKMKNLDELHVSLKIDLDRLLYAVSKDSTELIAID